MKQRGGAWNTIGGLIRLVRPLNCVMIFAGTYAGGIIINRFRAFDWPDNYDLLLAAASAALVGAGANAINDVFDVTSDAVNRPDRPIPRGAVTILAAGATWLLLTGAGIAVGFGVSVLHGQIAFGVAALMYLYSARLKFIPILGNMVVGASVSAALAYGALALGRFEPVIPAVLFAFLTNLAREVIKDVQDIRGDAVQNVRSLPVLKGSGAGVVIFFVLIAFTIVLTPVPYAVLGYGGLYLLLILFADGVLLAALWSGLRQQEENFAGRASALVKVAMVFGLVALSLAGVVG